MGEGPVTKGERNEPCALGRDRGTAYYSALYLHVCRVRLPKLEVRSDRMNIELK